MNFIFRKEADGKLAVHDSFVDNVSPTGHLVPVEDIETGRGSGYVVEGDLTEHFYSSREEAAEFLRGVRLRLPVLALDIKATFNYEVLKAQITPKRTYFVGLTIVYIRESFGNVC